jgi:hypothetical protein
LPVLPVKQVWRNTGSTFTNINCGLPGVCLGGTIWIDYDGDGLLDIFVTGVSVTNSAGVFDVPGSTNYISQLWKNTGSNFVYVTSFPGVANSSAAWGDYDNDGRPDLVLSGELPGGAPAAVTRLWHNTTNGFVDIGAGLPQLTYGTVAWADYDGDGRLDVLLCGLDTNSVAVTKIYKNNIVQTNSLPTPPLNLTATVSNSMLVLTWSAGTDRETAPSAVTYNVRVGTSAGGQNVVSPMAANIGIRRVVQMGNCYGRQFALLKYNPALTYYWSVQSIDSNFAGSPFATEQVVAPTLSASLLSPSTIRLSWSTNFPGFILESATQLLSSGTTWTAVSGSPATIGSQFTQDDTVAGEQFYRLRR